MGHVRGGLHFGNSAGARGILVFVKVAGIGIDIGQRERLNGRMKQQNIEFRM